MMYHRFYFIHKKLIVIFLSLLVINCFLYFLFVKDSDRMLSKLIKEESLLRKELEEAKVEEGRAVELNNNLKEIDEELNYFYAHILGTKEERVLKILEEIDSLAQRYNLPKRDLSFNHKELEKEKLIQFDIIFPLRGSYLDIREFIRHIEQSPNFLIINRIELISLDKTETNLSLNVHLQAYFSTSI